MTESTSNALRISAGAMIRGSEPGPGTVLIQEGRIADVLSTVHPEAEFHFPDGVLLPGLVDLHAHPAKTGSVFGAAPDETMLARGTTTVLSQGDAGADNIDGFLKETVRTSKTRVLLALNLSRIGESTDSGCFSRLADADVDACVQAASSHPDLVRMISVNVSHHACGETEPREILARGLLAAEQTGLPLLFGMRRPEDWPLDDQLRRLRSGDVVTYCFRRQPHCIVDFEKRTVLPCVREARERGVLFDVGHGMASFSFDVAEVAIGEGFLPDTISTDRQNRHAGQSPSHDLPLVMSKLAAAGMLESDIFRAVTETPASILKLETGSLEVGAAADLVVLARKESSRLTDARGETRTGPRYETQCVVKNGEVILNSI